MPTTLPTRSLDFPHGRTRGLNRVTAAIVLWALAMLALTLPTHPAHTADTDEFDAATVAVMQ